MTSARTWLRPDLAVGLAATVVLILITRFQALGAYSPTGQLEVAAVVLTGASVWLAVKNSIWNWVFGGVGTACYLILFFEWKLYADAGLQIFYIVLSAIGLWAWLRRRGDVTVPEAERTSALHLLAVFGCVAVGTVAVREYLIVVGGAAPFWDALLTSGSVGAQYLLIRKRIENWSVWAVLDVAYTILFIGRGYYLTAALYAVFLVMVIRAAFEWRQYLPEAGDGDDGGSKRKPAFEPGVPAIELGEALR
jgi:nicotinamide mononucleotide transporter